jgi:hypothetical protein
MEVNPSTIDMKAHLYNRQMAESFRQHPEAKNQNGKPLERKDTNPEGGLAEIL